MPKKLFVGGLSWNTDNQSLHQAFAKYGEVLEATVIYDRDTGRSKGFGFVTFSDDQAAIDAQAQMNGQTLDGRAIRVDVAQERARTGPPGGGRGGGDRGGYGGGGGRGGPRHR